MGDEWEESVEEKYGFADKKAGRKERKRVTARDRSKYKKTDQTKREQRDQLQREMLRERGNLSRGRVLSVTGQGASVDCEGALYTCFVRGLLKKERTEFKTLVTTGDFVWFEKYPDQEGLIAEVEPRLSVLARADPITQRRQQLLAANIDQVLITASVVDPLLKPTLIDRYIIAAQNGNMDPVVVINKIDLLDDPTVPREILEQERALLEECFEAYAQAGIPLLTASCTTEHGLAALEQAMQGKASVFSGQSGVGKSSLINALTGLTLETGETVKRTRKGAHTTTTASLLPLSCGGWCIDTPGIKSFGLWNLQKDEIEPHFAEIHAKGKECQFANCSHTHEQKCAVKAAIEEGMLSQLRYASYCALLEESDQGFLSR